ncbi:unnamed protein product [Oppiella nova]|uniref:Uncharacterized protein n=1 Tax=Oppiella nova TaxID=334625 RepID=A0A7R9M0U4_9ACAR|nr:unnamed protein product [Oppiella nova]CAG2168854.1 unnamed protein product [Oppiella nova]
MAPELDKSNGTELVKYTNTSLHDSIKNILGAIPKKVSSSISRNTESNVSIGYISSIREKFEKLSQNSKTGK